MNVQAMCELIRVLKAVPPDHFNMSTVGTFGAPQVEAPTRPEQMHTCGTAACALGYAALDPWFQERGLSVYLRHEHFLVLDEEKAGEIFGLGHRQLDQIFLAEHPLVAKLDLKKIEPAQMVEVVEAMIAKHLAKEAP